MRNFILGLMAGVILATAVGAYAISIAKVEEIAVACYNTTTQRLKVIGA